MYPPSPYLRNWVLIRWLTAGLRFDLLGLLHDVRRLPRRYDHKTGKNHLKIPYFW